MSVGPSFERDARLKLAHDLRGPVQAMQQALAALRFTGLPDEARGMMLEVFERQLAVLTNIARDLAGDLVVEQRGA